jgi:PKD repeat protein
MASPLVAGLVGLMKSHAASASNTDIINCLYSSADNIDAANSSYVGFLGAGRINAHQAMICSNSFAYQLDAGITEVNSPTGNLCSGTYSPEIVLRNFGSTTLTSATITYQVSGSGSQTLNWTGSLPTGQTETINLPSTTSASGNYTFTATTSSPNGSSDQNNSNDQSNTSFTVIPNGDEVSLFILTDCYGSEISWNITDDQSNQMASGGGYADITGGQLENTTICLAPGCYTFNINDSYGDGLHGSQWTCTVDGDYYMEDGNGNNLFSMTAVNGDFGNGTSHTFCISSSIQNDAGVINIINPSGSLCGNSVSPEIEIQNLGNQTLTSCIVNYQLNGGAIQTYNWSGSLTSNQTDLITLPNLNVANGLNSFETYTTLPNGNMDGNNLNDTSEVNFMVYSSGLNLPFTEDFENGFINQNWSLNNSDGGITWELATISGTSPGTQAAKMDFYNYGQQGERDFLTSPMLDFSSQTAIDFYFEYAYRRYDQNTSDSLIVSISIDCGPTFTRLLELGEDGTGSFATAYTNTASFTPTTGDWCMGAIGADCFTLDLSSYAGQSNVFVRFEGYNTGTTGNNLFIDNINISGDFVANCPEISSVTTDATCFGVSNGSVSLTATNGVTPITYSLDNNTYSSTSVFTGLAEGTYSAYAKGADGCIDSIQFVINQPTDIAINSAPIDADCGQSNGQITINATGGSAPYEFSINGGTTYSSNMTFTGLSAGNYSISVQDANNCTQSSSVIVNNNATSFNLTTSGDQTICSGSSVTISASGVPSGGNYSWDQSIGNGASHSVSPSVNTTYIVTGTDANGCSVSESVQITVNTTPSVTITSTNTTICEGETTTLIANGAQTYSWSTGATGSSITVTPSATTSYSAIGQNGSCSSSSVSQTINVNPLPVIMANASSTSVLTNESISFDNNGSNATNYNWDFGDGSTSSLSNDSHSYASIGTYTVTLTGELNGCSTSDNITIIVDDASSIEEQLSWSVNVYPNPSNGIITIQLTNIVSDIDLNVFDVQGKLVQSTITMNKNLKSIDVSHLNNGVYIMNFNNGLTTINRRVTILK